LIQRPIYYLKILSIFLYVLVDIFFVML